MVNKAVTTNVRRQGEGEKTKNYTISYSDEFRDTSEDLWGMRSCVEKREPTERHQQQP